MPGKAAIRSGIVPQAEAEADQFYIRARAPLTRPRRTLKHDDSFLVLDSHGDIGATAGEADGLFHCDTRYLARLELLVDGATPLLLGFNMRDDNLVYTVDLTNPDVYKNNRVVFEKSTPAHRAHHVSVALHRVPAACHHEPRGPCDRGAALDRLRQ